MIVLLQNAKVELKAYLNFSICIDLKLVFIFAKPEKWSKRKAKSASVQLNIRLAFIRVKIFVHALNFLPGI